MKQKQRPRREMMTTMMTRLRQLASPPNPAERNDIVLHLYIPVIETLCNIIFYYRLKLFIIHKFVYKPK